MNPIRSILVHVDASPRSTVRLAFARELARQHGAFVTALCALEPGLAPSFEPVAMVDSVFASPPMWQVDASQRQRARSNFDQVASQGGGPTMVWAELTVEPAIYGFARRAFYADLLVLGQHDPDDRLAVDVPRGFVESVVIDSGRPALIIPFAGSFGPVGRRPMVAWKRSRESARAVSGALPLMQGAQQVQVLSWGDEGPALSAEGDLDIEGYLRRHGIEATLHLDPEQPRNLGEVLLSRAADEGADLLVMGCYGHSRLSELVLGGVTRSVLKSMTMPVLMAH